MLAVIKQILVASLLVLATMVQVAQAQAQTLESSSRVPGPQFKLPENALKKCAHDVDPSKSGDCERDSEFMRVNHPALLLHKRDKTMRQGIRTKQDSLQNCINCHVTKDKEGQFIKATDPENGFCAACHKFVAVKVACFECHRTTPEEPQKTANIPRTPPHKALLASNANDSDEAKKLENFLNGVTR